MSYGLIYKVYIPSVRKNAYYLEIEKKDYTGECSTITGGSEPFITDTHDDDYVYTPLRLSTAKLSVVGGDSLSSLFATAYQQYRVTLLKDGIPLWCGFVKPELYTQDYSTHTHEIEMDCLSAISTLEYVKYTQSDTSGLKFVSLKSLISRALTAANAWYGKVYIPHTFAASADDYGTNALMRDDCVISEQNFFDEENKPSSYKDILEEICRFAHVTLYDDGGDLYFVDHDYTDAYDEWTLTGGALVLTKANAKTIGTHSVQDIGFGGSGHSMDIIAGYNKASVKTSNYNQDSKVFPDEEWDDLVQISDISATEDLGSFGVYKIRRKLLEGSELQTHYYAGTGKTSDGKSTDWSDLNMQPRGALYEVVNEVTSPQKYVYHTGYNEDLNFGAYMAKFSNFKSTDDKINYDYENVILLHKRMCSNYDGEAIRNYVIFDPASLNGLLNYRNHLPTAIYADGAIILSMQSRYIPASYNMLYYSGTKTGEAADKITFTLILRIGDNYYNGSEWTKTKSTFTVSSEDIDISVLSFLALKTNKTLTMPYDGVTGYVIPTGPKILYGEIYFSIMDCNYNCAIKDFSLSFQLSDDYILANNSSDRVYTNVVNGEYVSEMDEIEEKISSYNHDGLCFSKLLLGDNYISDNLYEGINKVTTRPENLLLRRIVNQYETPKVKLTQVLINSEKLLPINKLTDEYQGTNKKFIMTKKETRYRSDTSEVEMIEKA